MATEEKTSKPAKKFSLHATLAEANAAKPDDTRMRLFIVNGWPGEQGPLYCWSDGVGGTIIHVAKTRGISVQRADKVASPEAVSSLLAALTPEQRQTILNQYIGKRPGK